MAEDLRSFPVPNMVQGVSQQAPQNRRETQCEEQFDCINSPVEGAVARPGFNFNSLLVDADYTDSFFYEIKRGADEHYLVVITKASPDSELEVFDLNTGLPCDVIFEVGAQAYLNTVANPKDVFKATTVEDYTFIANREVIPLMDEENRSPVKDNAAIVYWKASAYKVRFQLAITYNDHVYTWNYETPDNSTVGNAEYITTNAVAATFYRTMTGLAASPTTSGATATGFNKGVGASFAGDDGSVGSVTGAGITAISLGFTLRLNGNCIMISRSDNAAFSVDTADGVGDTYMRAVKETAQAFSQLPNNAFEGFTCLVKGTNKETADDFYVQFTGGDGSQGYWQEVVAPDTPYTFDPDTMPHALINTGPGEFTFQIAPWGFRFSGDGINTSKDPSFVGRQIWDMMYDNNRLCIITEGAASWSKLNDPFVFFSSSAQTVLATDPVDVKIGGGKQIVLLRKGVQTNESTFLWAQQAQFRITSGQESFRQDTVDSKRASSYEFAETPDPLPVASSLYFATEPGRYATIRDLTLQNGQVQGDSDVTAHIKRYIKSGVRRMVASDTLGILAVTSDAVTSHIYVYNFLLGTNEQGAQTRLQSAWNTWRLPTSGQVLYATILANRMDMVIQRPDGVILATMDLSPGLTDTGQDDYLTRLDLRMDESNVSMSYSSVTNQTTISLPFEMTEGVGDEALGPDARKTLVVTRTNSANSRRGATWPIVEHTGDTIIVTGDCTDEELYIGFRITAERTESPFYVRSPKGMIPTTRLQVVNFLVTHAQTGYYRAEVTYRTRQNRPAVTQMTSRVIGDPANVSGAFPITDGQLLVPVNSNALECSIKLVNDSFLPSKWQTSEYQYMATFLAVPGVPNAQATGA
jgi:hypothetical protein